MRKLRQQVARRAAKSAQVSERPRSLALPQVLKENVGLWRLELSTSASSRRRGTCCPRALRRPPATGVLPHARRRHAAILAWRSPALCAGPAPRCAPLRRESPGELLAPPLGYFRARLPAALGPASRVGVAQGSLAPPPGALDPAPRLRQDSPRGAPGPAPWLHSGPPSGCPGAHLSGGLGPGLCCAGPAPNPIGPPPVRSAPPLPDGSKKAR